MIFNDRKSVNKKPVWNQRILDWNKWILQSVKYLNEMASWHKEIFWFQIFTLEKGWFDSKGLIRQWKAWWKGLCGVGRPGKPQSPVAISHLIFTFLILLNVQLLGHVCLAHSILPGERAAALYPREGTMPRKWHQKQQKRLYQPTVGFR